VNRTHPFEGGVEFSVENREGHNESDGRREVSHQLGGGGGRREPSGVARSPGMSRGRFGRNLGRGPTGVQGNVKGGALGRTLGSDLLGGFSKSMDITLRKRE